MRQIVIFNQKRENGSVTLVGITMVLLLSSLLLLLRYQLRQTHNRIIDRKNTYLCFTQYQKIIQKTHAEIKTINQLIQSANLAAIASFLFPAGAPARIGIKALVKALKFKQESAALLARKKLIELKMKGCLSFLGSLRIPFQTSSIVFLKRNKQGLAIAYRGRAPYLLTGKYFNLVGVWKNKRGKLNFSTREVFKMGR